MDKFLLEPRLRLKALIVLLSAAEKSSTTDPQNSFGRLYRYVWRAFALWKCKMLLQHGIGSKLDFVPAGNLLFEIDELDYLSAWIPAGGGHMSPDLKVTPNYVDRSPLFSGIHKKDVRGRLVNLARAFYLRAGDRESVCWPIKFTRNG